MYVNFTDIKNIILSDAMKDYSFSHFTFKTIMIWPNFKKAEERE